MKALAGDARLLVMLRDPVKRAYSHYHMSIDPNGTPAQKKNRGLHVWGGKGFEEVVAQELDELRQAGVDEKTSPEEFAEKYLCSRPNNHGSHSLLARGMYALQLKPWLEAFPTGQVKVIFLEDIVQSEESLQSAMNGVFEHIGLPPVPVEDKSPHNTREYPPLSEGTAHRLRRFYQCHDQALCRLLGRDRLPWPDAEPTSSGAIAKG
ncbi:unnamed protein product [Discosporangium mesarthrocarpum]